MDDHEDRYIYLNPVTLPNEDDQVMVNTFDTRHDVLIKHTTWKRGVRTFHFIHFFPIFVWRI